MADKTFSIDIEFLSCMCIYIRMVKAQCIEKHDAIAVSNHLDTYKSVHRRKISVDIDTDPSYGTKVETGRSSVFYEMSDEDLSCRHLLNIHLLTYFIIFEVDLK